MPSFERNARVDRATTLPISAAGSRLTRNSLCAAPAQFVMFHRQSRVSFAQARSTSSLKSVKCADVVRGVWSSERFRSIACARHEPICIGPFRAWRTINGIVIAIDLPTIIGTVVAVAPFQQFVIRRQKQNGI